MSEAPEIPKIEDGFQEEESGISDTDSKLDSSAEEDDKSKEDRIKKLREAIGRAEKREDEQKITLLEAELHSVEGGKEFDRATFLLDVARAKNRHRPSVLRDMLDLAHQSPDSVWSWDGPSTPSYEKTFRTLLRELDVYSFQELVDTKSKDINRKVKVLDLFGGAYYIRDLTNVFSITGVRLEKRWDDDEDEESKRKIIEGDLYRGKTWREIERKGRDGDNGFDLITCRPEGAFGRNTGELSLKDIEDEGLVREEFFVTLLNRAADLLSEEDGVLFSQIPNLPTPQSISDSFWAKYMEEMERKGYEFVYDGNVGVYPKSTFAIIRHKTPSSMESEDAR